MSSSRSKPSDQLSITVELVRVIALQQATLEIQNAYSGNTSLYFPVKKNVAQEELRKEREKLRKVC